MERGEWLKKVRNQAEKLYNHEASGYWVMLGLSIDETQYYGSLERFYDMLKESGFLYVTADIHEGEADRNAYKRVKAMGLPVVMGEVVDELDEAFLEALSLVPLNMNTMDNERLDHTVYHYHPTIDQVCMWITQVGMLIVEQERDCSCEYMLLQKK